LYKKFGFLEVAKRRGYYNGVDGILMELILWRMFIF
jgi:ribosome modulation factor